MLVLLAQFSRICKNVLTELTINFQKSYMMSNSSNITQNNLNAAHYIAPLLPTRYYTFAYI